MDRKKTWAAGIVVLVLAGAGLFTAFATSSAAAEVTVSQQEGIKISSINSSVGLGTTFGFGRGYKDTSTTLWRIDPDPSDQDETTDFRLTVTQHTNMSDAMSKLQIRDRDGELHYSIYGEEGKIVGTSYNDSSWHDFYVNPGSGSTTLYVEITNDDSGNESPFEVRLESSSWAKTPFTNPNPTYTLVASGKALE